MNTKSHFLDLTVSSGQVEEAIKAVFHAILFHRTTGKYSYSSPQSGTFSVGTVGFEDVDCSTLQCTYVRCSSPELDESLSQQVEGFTSSLCQQGGPSHSGKVSLEFYEKKKSRWLLPPEAVNWEVWHLQLSLVEPMSDEEWQEHQQKLSEHLSETVLYICEAINRPDYLPRNPTFDNLPNVFDVRFSNVQPYLHRVTYELGTETVAGTVRKLIRNTFAY